MRRGKHMPLKIQGETEWELILEIVGIIARNEGFLPPANLDVISERNPRTVRWTRTAQSILSAVEKRLNQEDNS